MDGWMCRVQLSGTVLSVNEAVGLVLSSNPSPAPSTAKEKVLQTHLVKTVQFKTQLLGQERSSVH